MSGILRLLGRVERLRRLQSQALAEKLEEEPPKAPEPAAPEPQRSIEERFWEFWGKAHPKFHRPAHFRRYVQQVLAAVGGDLRLVFAAPPQHGKTEVTLALLAFLTIEFPARRWAYITYSQKRANSVSRKFKRLLSNAGHPPGGTLEQLYLDNGGQFLFVGIDGGITGEPVDGAAVIDDPFKGRKEADSPARRQAVLDAYQGAIETRVHPGASIILLATRWHPEDLSGKLIEEGWDDIKFQALAEGPVNDNGIVRDDPNARRVGEALFPELWSAEDLARKKVKVGEFTWSALYQGRPRPRGGTIYHEPTYYTRLPDDGFRGCFGLDLAFTAKTAGKPDPDWSVCVELIRETPKRGELPRYFVVWVDRKQVDPSEFRLILRARHVKRPIWSFIWRASGTEKGAASLLKASQGSTPGLPVVWKPPPGDKLVMAQGVSAAWNDGRVLVPDPEAFPRCEEWLHAFLGVILNFTGSGKELDDDSDALSNAFDQLDVADDGGLVTAKSKR